MTLLEPDLRRTRLEHSHVFYQMTIRRGSWRRGWGSAPPPWRQHLERRRYLRPQGWQRRGWSP